MRKISPIAFMAMLLLTNCSDETTVFENPEENIQIETNQEKLDNSVLFDKAGVLDIYENPAISAKRKALTGKAAPESDYPLTLVAQISPPTFTGGENLTATHVVIDGDYGFVSYNTVGPAYVGGVDVVNISDPNNPFVASRLYYSNADLNAIAYDGAFIYVVGGVDAEQSVLATANSFIAKVPFSGGSLDTANITYAFQEGFNATDVTVSGSRVFVTSGRDGFVVAYNSSDLTPITEAAFTDLRAVTTNGVDIAILDASSGVNILDSNLSVTQEIGINSDFGVDAKRTIDYSGENIIVSEGSKGAGIYNVVDGSFIEYVPILLSPENAESTDIVTNGVAVNEDIMLMANGAAGLCLSEKLEGDQEAYGIIELTGSINSVASKGDYIFAASGRSGFQIIKLNRPTQSLVESCTDLDTYSGDRRLTVNVNQDLAFRGSYRFNRINIEGALLLCGSWTVNNQVTLAENALLEMNGTFVVARNNRRRNVVVNSGATLTIEGNLTIYGDLILEDGATVNFIGNNSIATIIGDVVRNGEASVTGSFIDYYNKF